MKLTFLRNHKSITSFPDIELPDFVVLTGVNGAGKSHLLEAIENGSAQIDNVMVNNQTRPIRRFDWINLIPQDTGAFAPSQIAQERHGFWTEISQYRQEFRPQISQTLQQLNRSDLDRLNTRDLLGLTIEDLKAAGSTPEQADQIVQAIQGVVSVASQNVSNRFVQSDPANRPRLLDLLQRNTNIPLIALEEEDFYNHFPRSWLPVDMFQQSFGRLFAEYQRNWFINRLKAFAHSEGESVSYLTDEEFLDRYGEPPWDFVNSILEAANLDFRINQPSRYEDRPYEPILTDQVSKSQVRFNDLSSGERVLMSFALCLYYAGDRRQLIDYPKILLFDEIDAPMHPSMTQSLLSTIQEVLIERHGIKVILTTHSPSTVALSPEESLYAMYKTNERRVQKSTKDGALSILTTGVPTLSVSYENRRQVFVESQHDARIYGQLYEKLRDRLVPEVSLTFIASGAKGQGNSSQVRDVVNRLKQGGNRTVYGIIDWDLTNIGNDRIKVLGQGHRYSIENYVLDPILVAALLLREKWIVRGAVGLDDHETYSHLATFDDFRLQMLADFIVNKVRSHVATPLNDENIACQYLNGRTLNLPKWFLRIQGHQLEAVLKEAFQELNRFQKEPDLKLEIIAKVVDDVPTLLPYDLLSLLREIQDVS